MGGLVGEQEHMIGLARVIRCHCCPAGHGSLVGTKRWRVMRLP
jgi:hypothetical protein